MRRDSLLDAARLLLAEGGAGALTFPELAARTGLARSSVYEYFRSRAAVVEALCEADLPLWCEEVAAAMAEAAGPEEKLAAFVRRQLALAAGRPHRAAVAVAAAELGEESRERIRAAHGRLTELVVAVLEELGRPEPRLTAALIQGTVDAAVRHDSLGTADPEQVARHTVELVLHGARGTGGR